MPAVTSSVPGLNTRSLAWVSRPSGTPGFLASRIFSRRVRGGVLACIGALDHGPFDRWSSKSSSEPSLKGTYASSYPKAPSRCSAAPGSCVLNVARRHRHLLDNGDRIASDSTIHSTLIDGPIRQAWTGCGRACRRPSGHKEHRLAAGRGGGRESRQTSSPSPLRDGLPSHRRRSGAVDSKVPRTVLTSIERELRRAAGTDWHTRKYETATMTPREPALDRVHDRGRGRDDPEAQPAAPRGTGPTRARCPPFVPRVPRADQSVRLRHVPVQAAYSGVGAALPGDPERIWDGSVPALDKPK